MEALPLNPFINLVVEALLFSLEVETLLFNNLVVDALLFTLVLLSKWLEFVEFVTPVELVKEFKFWGGLVITPFLIASSSLSPAGSSPFL